jgi:hypothetical protein
MPAPSAGPQSSRPGPATNQSSQLDPTTSQKGSQPGPSTNQNSQLEPATNQSIHLDPATNISSKPDPAIKQISQPGHVANQSIGQTCPATNQRSQQCPVSYQGNKTGKMQPIRSAIQAAAIRLYKLALQPARVYSQPGHAVNQSSKRSPATNQSCQSGPQPQ